MWLRLNKLIKDNGAIVLFGSEPFSSKLRLSNLEMYNYNRLVEEGKLRKEI
jgi:site-specific DNA-methyltransferase (adenine-specific)